MDDIEKRIELKKLEIEKLKLERELDEIVINPNEIGVQAPDSNQEKSSVLTDVLRVGIGILILWVIFRACSALSTQPPKTTTYQNYNRSESKTKTCSWCGETFTGYGYYHLLNTCNVATENSIEGNLCSLKCCMESSRNH